MNKDRVLVTGGAGFIGSHLVDQLLNLGYIVTVVDDFSVGTLGNLEAARKYGNALQVVKCDITDPGLLAVIEDSSPRYIFHLAAQADVRKSIIDPIYDARVNLLGSINVIQGAVKAGVERIVYAASGGTIYGEPSADQLPIVETTPHNPLSYYGVSKKGVVDYLRAQHSITGMKFVALALANVYGPRQDPHGESGVVSIFAGNLCRGHGCVIYGDGTQTRDFVHVDDVVAAFVRAVESRSEEVINISSGQETSVYELYLETAKLTHSDLKPTYKDQRIGEVLRSCLSNEKARLLLDWTPKVDIHTGLESVVDWVRRDQRARALSK